MNLCDVSYTLEEAVHSNSMVFARMETLYNL